MSQKNPAACGLATSRRAAIAPEWRHLAPHRLKQVTPGFIGNEQFPAVNRSINYSFYPNFVMVCEFA
jgi:hypothetical protein